MGGLGGCGEGELCFYLNVWMHSAIIHPPTHPPIHNRNISALYNTAKRELGRKDGEVAALREKVRVMTKQAQHQRGGGGGERGGREGR